MPFFKSSSVATFNNDMSTVELSIIQLARKRTVMRSLEQGEFTLQAPPANKMRIRDAPRMECASLKKNYNRSTLCESLRGAIKLNVVPTTQIRDRSAPVIDADVRLRFSERRAFLHALLLQVEKFYQRVLATASHIHHTSIETAIYVRENAPAKIQDMYEAGTHKVVDIYEAGSHKVGEMYEVGSHTVSEVIEAGSHLVEAGRETAVNTQTKATHLIGSGKVALNKAKTNAQGLLETSQEIAQEAQSNAVGLAKSAATKTSSIASTFANAWTELYIKGKNLLSSDHEEILLTKKRRPLRRATSEAAIYRAYAELLREVEQNRQNLNHVLLSEIRDRSKPFVMSPDARIQNATKNTLAVRGAVLNEIKRSATCMTLNHVSIRDSSAPALPKSVSNLQNDARKKLVDEINGGAQVLHAAPVPTADRSAPVLPMGETIRLNKMAATKKSLLAEVQEGVDLSHYSPRLIKDRSAPMVVSPGLGTM